MKITKVTKTYFETEVIMLEFNTNKILTDEVPFYQVNRNEKGTVKFCVRTISKACTKCIFYTTCEVREIFES